MVEDKVKSNIRTNSIKQKLYPYVYNNGIHALTTNDTGSLYVGNGLAQLYKYLDIEAANVIEGWTPAPEDIGLSTDTVQHFLFHIQDYIFDNYSHLVSKYGGNGNYYDKCLALLNQSETYIYLDYEVIYDGKKEHFVTKDKVVPDMFTKDKLGKLCYDYSISVGDLDNVDMYIHEFYLGIVPNLTYNTMGNRLDIDMFIQQGGN